MEQRRITRRQAIIRRRIFLGAVAAVLAIVIALAVFIITSVTDDTDEKKNKSDATSGITSNVTSENNSSENESVASSVTSSNSSTESSKNDKVTSTTTSSKNESTSKPVNTNLDADFSCLLLVNGSNPLPDTYDSDVRKDLVEIDKKYRNNNYVTKIHKDVYPYITAMVAAAQAEGVDLKVWSPFRSYGDQKVLFQNQVNRVGGDEALAATVVARPGTSEHNTGLCADFNMASDAFENTKMYTWMKENAEDYGFVMRYRKDKQPITGVIHESWHWRFVGINNAKEMNRLDMCLEEYVEYLEKNN